MMDDDDTDKHRNTYINNQDISVTLLVNTVQYINSS